MSGDNGKLINKEESSDKIEMRIVCGVNNQCIVHFPLLNDKVATYGFLKLAEKTLDAHYLNESKKKIIPFKNHKIMDFVRQKKNGK